LLGAALGHAWSAFWPGTPIGFFALLGAGAVLAATTQGPVSSVVLLMELTGRDRSFILPLILVAGISTLISRSIEHRSIYDARLSDEQIALRQKLRDEEPNQIGVPQ
jgi:H+/Cl- antiporter ClcA